MQVIKRNGQRESCSFDKITQRLSKLSAGLAVDPSVLAQKVVAGVVDGIHTSAIDKFSAETAACMATVHHDYGTLAGRIAVSNLQKNTLESFSETMELLHSRNNRLFSERAMAVVRAHAHVLDKAVDFERDFLLDHFAFQTLERAYLLKADGKVVERPQHMYMRVALGVHFEDLNSVIDSYHRMSKREFTHATPTMFNACFRNPQMSSCFLLQMRGDSIDDIFDTVKQCALISKSAGGIGMGIHNVRAKNAPIMGTNGTSNGIVPMLRVFDATARYVDQCFAPETVVYTTLGMKQIDQLVIGDLVFTGSGKTERVAKVFRSTENTELLNITLKHGIEPVRVTAAHPMWTLRQRKGLNFSVIKNRLDKNYAEMEWVNAGDLKPTDFIGFSIPSHVSDIPEYTMDDCRFYGIMVGDGHISRDGKQAFICGNTSTADWDFYGRYLFENGCRYTTTDRDGTYTSYTFAPEVSGMFKFGRGMLYDDNAEKIIHPSMLHLPLEKAMQIVKGVVETDGFISDDRKGTEIVLEMTSKNVIESVAYILLRAGVLTSGAVVDRVDETHVSEKRGRFTTRKLAYRLRIPKVRIVCDLFGYTELASCVSQFRYDNYVFTRIDSIEKSTYDGLTYDLETEGPEHTYLTRLGLAHNGGGKRKGSFAIYLEPWHADIEDFLLLKQNQGKEESKTRDLFLGLWTPDLFWKRLKADADWTLFSPDTAPGLHLVWGAEFEALYEKYEMEGRGVKTIKAMDLFMKIHVAAYETGAPYINFKDSANRRSNHQHLGTITNSNLCTEILQYTSKEEVAVCNLASISLPAFLLPDGTYDFERLKDTARVVTRNLNKVIDNNFYPVPEARTSNMKHRPIGVGVQGLADVFASMGFAFDSPEARALNTRLFETIYYGCVDASCELAERDGAYASYAGSPFSKGMLQFDMWPDVELKLDWTELKARVVKFGTRNSLLTTVMPTASTAQILGNNEACEAFSNNVYARRTIAGNFFVVNKWLVRDLERLGMWNKKTSDAIIASGGSVQTIPGIPDTLKQVYRTVWEIKQLSMLEMNAARAPFIDQSQSQNIFMGDDSLRKFMSLCVRAWELGVKTLYYIRVKQKVMPDQFTVNNAKVEVAVAAAVVAEEEEVVCESCSA